MSINTTNKKITKNIRYSSTPPTTDVVVAENTLLFEIDTGTVYKYTGGSWSDFSGAQKSEVLMNKTIDIASNNNIITGITNSSISITAAIDYTKLNLAGQIKNTDIQTAAGIPYSKLNLATSITNADISASAAISSSKLSLQSASTSVSGIVLLATPSSDTTAGHVVQASDTRLSDTRTPTAHATTHKTGGTDSIKLDELAATTDVTTLNSSITAHGLLPKLSNNSANYLNGVGGWTTPSGSWNPTGTETLGNKTIPIDTNIINHSTTNTLGDLLKSNGTRFVRLGIGSANQVLAVNAGGTDLAWVTNSGTGAPTTSQYVTLALDAGLSAERTLAVGTGLTLVDAGANSTVTLDYDPLINVTKRFTFVTDFTNFIDLWSLAQSGTGATTGLGNFNAGAIGEANPVTGTTATGYATFLHASINTLPIGYGIFTCIMRIKIPTLSTGTQQYIIRIGLLDNLTNADAVNGVYFEYDSSSSLFWKYCTSNASTRTKTASSQLATTSYTTLKIVINAAASSVEYFYDGASLGTLTTNIPSGISKLVTMSASIVKSIGTTSLGFYLDYYVLSYNLTTTR